MNVIAKRIKGCQNRTSSFSTSVSFFVRALLPNILPNGLSFKLSLTVGKQDIFSGKNANANAQTGRKREPERAGRGETTERRDTRAKAPGLVDLPSGPALLGQPCPPSLKEV